MNWKLVILGGLAFWITTTLIGMFVTGYLIHEMVLDGVYQAHQEFWWPALNQDPPDIGALLPHWLLGGLLTSLVFAGIYGVVRGSFTGAGWLRGVKYCFCLALIGIVTLIGWSGVFALPMELWIWWGVDYLILYLAGGAALGWVGQRFAAA